MVAMDEIVDAGEGPEDAKDEEQFAVQKLKMDTLCVIKMQICYLVGEVNSVICSHLCKIPSSLLCASVICLPLKGRVFR